MKNILSLNILILILFTKGYSQDMFPYQALIRNSAGEIISNQVVGIKIDILKDSPGGITLYSETFAPGTNEFGLVSLEVGNGTPVAGNFGTIDWSSGTYFISVSADVNGGTNYSLTGTSPLLSVPYALHAKTAQQTFSRNYNDLSNAPDFSGFITDNEDADANPDNEIQSISISNDTIWLENGGFVKLPSDQTNDDDRDGMNEKLESLRLNGRVLEITESGITFSVDLSTAENSAYEQGLSAGYTSGYEGGHDDGMADGYADGYDTSYPIGVDDGEVDGFNDGWDAGYQAGYAQGETTGYANGESDGYNDGYDLGWDDGYDAAVNGL